MWQTLFSRNAINFCRQVITCMRALMYLKSISNSQIALPYLKEKCMKNAISRFHKIQKDDPIIASTNLFGDIVSIHTFEEGNGRICFLTLACVLIKIMCSLFSVFLSSFHKRIRIHYIRAVKMFEIKLSILHIMIVQS